MRTVAEARALASAHMCDLGPRWSHVQGVGRLAEGLSRAGLVGSVVPIAAWLHDIGYGPAVVVTGFHPLDGARYLLKMGAPADLVGLVAHHTGAKHEAKERGLADELSGFPVPKRDQLDVLTLVDLVIGPDGHMTTPEERISEIRSRYAENGPVFRAVSRSSPELLAAAARARARLGLADEWPVLSAEGVLQPESHRGM